MLNLTTRELRLCNHADVAKAGQMARRRYARAHGQATGGGCEKGDGRDGRMKERCRNGHERTPENTYLRPGGGRSCRACKRQIDRTRRLWQSGQHTEATEHRPAPTFKDITGLRFGKFVVLRLDHRIGRASWKWACRCDCGNETTVSGGQLRSGGTKGCVGCSHINKSKVNKRKWRPRPEYQTWLVMQRRCDEPKMRSYDRYGGRGIIVCDRWRLFANFLADMGPRPAGTSIDRIDNDGNYEPGNCRWATRAEQNRNRSNNVWVIVNGKRMIMADAAAELGITRQAANALVANGKLRKAS